MRIIQKKNIGLLLGPLLFILAKFFFHPEGLSDQANAILACTLWIAVWWITEAIPIAATALLPIVLFPLTGGLSIGETTASFGHKYIFLYLGGFILAIAIEKFDSGIPQFICIKLNIQLMFKRIGTQYQSIVQSTIIINGIRCC